MTTLKEALESLKIIIAPKRKRNISTELLGKYIGALPKGKTSTGWIRGLRGKLYGKIN